MTEPAGFRRERITAQDIAARTVNPAIRELDAYQVPPARDVVKLDAMENPWPMPEALRAQWLEALRGSGLNRYPDAAAEPLKAALREAFRIPGQAGVILGNGSDEIIQIIATAVDGPVLAPAPSFVMYGMIARFLGRRFVEVPLDSAFELDADAMVAAARRHRPAVVFIAYPNNPTGNLFDEPALRAVIEAAPGLVVIDEAYHAFAGRSWLPAVEDHPKLLVMRTLSKLGLAGLRFGFAAAHPAWIDELDKIRLPYNVGTLTQTSVAFALEHLEAFEAQAAAIRAERRRVLQALSDAGYACFPSEANFILFRCRTHTADAVFESLLEQGVLIKNLSASHPALSGCLRVTIGTPQENDRFLAALPR